jgi:hypothetical protein
VKANSQWIAEKLSDRSWRLNNLYYIIDKQGNRVKFSMNWAQKELYENLWYCNIILKARQLGLSTFTCILFLDAVLFNSHTSAGIIADTRENAKNLFKKVKFAYDNLPLFIKSHLRADADSANELRFSNGSSIRTGTSMRSTSLQYLMISEFGKICRFYPSKAQEVITGSLNALGYGQYCIIESTAEGRDGYFYEMCQKSMKQKEMEQKLTPLDFRFHFFPWYKHPDYQMKDEVLIDGEKEEYFLSLNIDLLDTQKWWYVKKEESQGEEMMKEYPSTPEESFKTSTDGLFYAKQMSKVYAEKRICAVPWDETLEVHTAWDLGFDDSTAIWFFQLAGREIHIIDYFEASGEPLTFYLKMIKERPYLYGKHYVPHDAQVREYSTGLTRIETALKVGIHLTPVPKLSVHEGIDAVRTTLGKCYFDEKKCQKGLKCLESYSKEWNASLGAFSDSPRHDEHSHGSDAFRYMCIAINGIATRGSMTESDAIKYERMYR